MSAYLDMLKKIRFEEQRVDSEAKNERKWFEKGAFEDGYQFGDVTRTILGTSVDVSENLTSGVLGMGENIIDAGAYAIGGIGGLLGADKLKSNMKSFIQKDLYDEKKVAEAIILGKANSSVLGDKADSLVQSAGQLAGTVGLQAVGVPWYLTSGVTSFGAEVEGALNSGASYRQAGLSGAISAGAEVLTEKLFGGSGLGEKGLINLEPLTRGISGKIVKALADFGVDMASEGAEEVVSQFASNLGSALYREEKLADILFSEEAVDGYIESAIGGGILGGIMNASNVTHSVKTGRDYRTGLTDNETKVIDKVVADEIAKEGGKVTKKREAEIRDRVEKDMDKGYITTDTIEEVLGKEASEMVKGDRLIESYNEKTRKGQKFEADLSKYNEKERATVQKAIDSGFLNNTNKTHDFVDLVAKVASDKGINFDFSTNEKLKESGFSIDGKIINGVKTDSGIILNAQANKSMDSLVGHEITHVLKDTDLYETLSSAITEYAKSKGDYQHRLDTLTKLYEGVEKVDINEELTADLVGDYLFTDSEFVKSLSTSHRNVFEKIYDEIKYLCKVATAGSEEAKKLEKVKKVFEDVWRENKNTATDGGTKYSVAEIVGESGKNYGIGVYLDSDLLTGLSDAERKEMVKLRVVEELAGNSFVAYDNGNPVEISIARRDDKITNAGGAKRSVLKELHTKYNYEKMKQEAVVLADELIEASSGLPSEKSKYPHDWLDNYGKNDWDKRTVYLQDKNKAVWTAILHIANAADGRKILYDIGPIKMAEGAIQLAPTTANAIKPQETQKVNGEFSLSDDTGIENDVKVMEGGSVTKYSLTTWTPETQKRVENDLIRAGYEKDRVDKWIKDTNSVASVIAADRDRLDFEAADNHTMLKNNQEYVKTLDASTLCSKRLAYQGTFDAIQHRMPNTVLSSDDLIELANMMKEHGIETPCAVCYVESRRRHLGKFAQEWLNGYNGEYKPNLDDVTTSDGLEKLRKTHPATYEDFMTAMKKKGSANPKVVQLRTEYRNEIMDLTPAQIRKIESIGGLRVQSFSDFETPHLLDMMQAVMDMSAKGLTSQAYTKVPNFAWVFGDTGIKINLSLIAEGDGFDADGNLAFSSVEGMDFNEAMKLRDAYSKNVGTIIVGANDKHILACMADDRIDFIIPFHRSGWGQKELDMMGMSSYSDYTYGQNEHSLETGKTVENLYPPDYWDFNISGKENAERYLNLCAKTGREPKFSQFLVDNGDGSYSLQPDGSTDGYWKTLIDFKMYDNDGNGSAQQKVQPNFNMDEAYRVLEEYDGGANKLPVANDVVEEFVAKHSKDAKYSVSDDLPIRNDIGLEMPDDLPTRETVAENATVDDLPIREDITTTEDKFKAKLSAVQTELENNTEHRKEAWSMYNQKISNLQAEYDAKKDKATKTAQDILRSIERLTRLRDSADADYEKRIHDLEARVEKMNSSTYKTAMQRKAKQKEYQKQMEELIGDTTTWVDKKLGISYKVNTLRRNLRDIVRDENGKRDIKKADAIWNELQGKYNHNEAELNREATRIKDAYAKQKITEAEDAYIQMLGELRHNPDTTLTEDMVKEFYEKHKSKIDTEKVDKIIDDARKTYDDLLIRVNEVLREQGMKEIPYRKGYFPHFTEDKQSPLAKLFNWKTKNNDIPTDIAGLTEQFNPNRSWQSFNKQRTSDVTDYSFTKGLDSYVQGALDWVYHIDDIQKRRAFENYIRYIHSDEGVKAKIDAIRKNEEYDADEMQDQIDLVMAEAKNPLNNFVVDLRAGTNTLANKKSSMDRSMEETTNRKFYSTMTNISNRVSANMVAGSVSSALTNFIPITQSWGVVSPKSSLKAMGDTIRSAFSDDGVIDKSDFLTNRLRKADNLYKSGWDKASEKLGMLMEAVDSFTSQTVWRSKYLENISNGMSEAEAIQNADEFAESVMAGRSRGNMPTIFDSKNPMVKTLTAFQLEVANQYGYMFKDMPQDMANETKGKLLKGYATMFLGAYAYNALYSSLTGRDAAFDPISIIQELLGDLFDDDEETNALDALTGFADNLVEELPFVGGLAGGGRIPISSALPYDGLYSALTGTMEDIANEDWASLTEEWMNPVYYLALPMGGGQIRKSIKGLQMFDDDLPIAGSYTNSGKLRFAVEDTPLKRAQAAVFGQYASKEARDYFDSGRSPMSPEKHILSMAITSDVNAYRKYNKDMSEITADKDKAGNAIQGSKKRKVAEYINGLDLDYYSKIMLFKSQYNSDHRYNRQIISYLNDREDITYDEKLTILRELGFEVSDDGRIRWG